MSFAEETSDVFAEYANFEKRETPAKIDKRSLWRMPDCCGKIQSMLPTAGKSNSTVRGKFRTGYFARKKIS